MKQPENRSPDRRRERPGSWKLKTRLRFSPEGLEKLREAALKNKPWQYSTGPRTKEGKARSAANGRWRQRGKKSLRQTQRELADWQQLLQAILEQRWEETLRDGPPGADDESANQ